MNDDVAFQRERVLYLRLRSPLVYKPVATIPPSDFDDGLRRILEPQEAWSERFRDALAATLKAFDGWGALCGYPKPFSTGVTRHCASNRRRMLAWRREQATMSHFD